MMDELDNIPWHQLTHAYGSAEDVPELLRELRTASPDLQGEDSPLWHLFGNIWHQGTVYEATSYAVPFLIEAAVDPTTPDRAGILQLLTEIANGSSYRAVHGNLQQEPDFTEKRAQESDWAARAQQAVVAGYEKFVAITREPGDVCFAAANLLARLPVRKEATSQILRTMLTTEMRETYRAGLLLLLGVTGDSSEETRDVLLAALDAEIENERHAAAFAIGHLKVRALPPKAFQVMMDAVVENHLEESLEGELPWQLDDEIFVEDLFAKLSPGNQKQVVMRLIAALEAGRRKETEAGRLVMLAFPLVSNVDNKVTVGSASRLQMRAIRALYNAMKGGKRIFSGHFPSWGLPDSMRDWRALASGRDPTPPDERQPVIASEHAPGISISPADLYVGQRILSRYFGAGTVLQLEPEEDFIEVTVDFDEEGITHLGLAR